MLVLTLNKKQEMVIRNEKDQTGDIILRLPESSPLENLKHLGFVIPKHISIERRKRIRGD